MDLQALVTDLLLILGLAIAVLYISRTYSPTTVMMASILAFILLGAFSIIAAILFDERVSDVLLLKKLTNRADLLARIAYSMILVFGYSAVRRLSRINADGLERSSDSQRAKHRAGVHGLRVVNVAYIVVAAVLALLVLVFV